jgi:inositol transport system substrate-binding protein
MKKRYRVIVALMVAAGIALLAGCSKKNADGKIRIGYVCVNFNDTRQVYVMNEFKDYFADKPEYELILVDSQEDVIKQQDQVNTLISQGVKILVVVPANVEAVSPMITAAADAKIPLVFLNRDPFSGDKSKIPPNVYYLGSQPIISGQLQGELVGKLLGGTGNIAILMGTLGHEATTKRTEGNEQTIAEKYPAIKVLAKETANWQRDQGMTITENWLTAYGNNLNAILSNNDEMALGAIEALRVIGRDDVVVMGIDGIQDAFAAVKNGSMAATVLLDPAEEGRGVAEVAYKLLRGEPVSAITTTTDVFITLENIDSHL